MESFKHEWKMTWLPTWQHFLLEEFSRGQVSWATSNPVGVNQLVHWFLGGKGLGIQQGMSVQVGSPKSLKPLDKKLGLQETPTWGIFFYSFFSILPTTPTVDSTNLVLAEILDQLLQFLIVV